MIAGVFWQRRQELDQHCVKILENAYRPGTLRNFRTRTKSYYLFCEYYNLIPYPADEWQLLWYVRYLGDFLTSYDSVRGYLSAVKRVHELGKIQYPKETFLLEKQLTAIRRELAKEVCKAAPITPSILRDVYQQVDVAIFVRILFIFTEK